MNISFHGAAGTVTGTKHLLTLDDGRKILLDCGLFQGLGSQTANLNQSFGFEPAEIGAVLLSHAHIDHSGLLPKLVADGFNGPIFCTAPTRELSSILLMDSAQIQNQTHEGPDDQCIYTPEDVVKTIQQIKTIEFDEWFEPMPDVKVVFTRTGHLSGAAAISLDLPAAHGRTTLAFSGDVGRHSHPLWQQATAFPQADYLVLESTYGDRDHDLRSSNVDILASYIQHTCNEKKGKLIIPAFSVGRTQEILYLLHQLEAENRLPELQYFVDSPLGIAATHVLASQLEEFKENLQQSIGSGSDPFQFKGLKYVESTEDSIRLKEYQEPCVIIASSGTADAGRVRHHIRETLGDPKNTILFSGYCGPQTLGGRLLSDDRIVSIAGEDIAVKAEIHQLLGLSAHGDSNDLCQFIACQDPSLVRGIFIVHGERNARERLAARLKAKNFYPVTLPEMHECITLNRHVQTDQLSLAPAS